MTDLIYEFVRRSKDILGDELVGVYLHGSSVMGCFNPNYSDIDIIVIVNETPSFETKLEFLEMTVELDRSAPPKGIETSIVKRSVCDPFVYPTPYELHYSKSHLERYLSDPEGYVRDMNGLDKDLAAHFTVIRARGKCLYGLPIGEAFGKVSKEDYLDSIIFDIENAREEIGIYTTYLTLNLARV